MIQYIPMTEKSEKAFRNMEHTVTESALLATIDQLRSQLAEAEKNHSRALTDARKKAEDMGRKVNELHHENKKLKSERDHAIHRKEEIDGMFADQIVEMGKVVAERDALRQQLSEAQNELREVHSLIYVPGDNPTICACCGGKVEIKSKEGV